MNNPLTRMLRRLGIGAPRGPDVTTVHPQRKRAVLLVDFGGTAAKFYELYKKAVSYEGILSDARREYDVVTAVAIMPEFYITGTTRYVRELEMMGYLVRVVADLAYDKRERRDRVDDTILSEARLWLGNGNVDVAVLVTEHGAVSAEQFRIERATGKKFITITPSKHVEQYTAKEHETALRPQLFIKAEDVREIIMLARKGDPIPESLVETATLVATLFAAFSSPSMCWVSAAELLDRMKTIAWEHNRNLHPSVASMLYRVFAECKVLHQRKNKRGKERFMLALDQAVPPKEKHEQCAALAACEQSA